MQTGRRYLLGAWFLTFGASLFSTTTNALAQSRPTVVAVFPVQGRGAKLKPNIIDAMTEYVAVRLASSGRFSVVPRADIEAALRDLKIASYEKCYDSSCQIEVGNELAAQQTVNTQIIRIANVCTVSITFFDLRTKASVFAKAVEGGCEDAGVLKSIRTALGGLGQSSLPAPQPRPKPAPSRLAGRGSLVVSTVPPGANIWVDGQDSGRNSPSILELAAGSRNIEVIYGTARAARTIEVVSGNSERLEIEIEGADMGRLRIQSQPSGAEVVLDGSPIGSAPLITDPLPVGTVTLIGKFRGGQEVETTAEVLGAQTRDVRISSPQAYENAFMLSAGPSGGISGFDGRLLWSAGGHIGGGLSIDNWTFELDVTFEASDDTDGLVPSILRVTPSLFFGRFVMVGPGAPVWQLRIGGGLEFVANEGFELTASGDRGVDDEVRPYFAAEPGVLFFSLDDNFAIRWSVVRLGLVPWTYTEFFVSSGTGPFGSFGEEGGIEVRFTTQVGVSYFLF